MKDVTNNKFSDNSINSKQKYIQLNKEKKAEWARYAGQNKTTHLQLQDAVVYTYDLLFYMLNQPWFHNVARQPSSFFQNSVFRLRHSRLLT